MEDSELKRAEEHLQAAKERLKAAETAEERAVEQLHFAEREERVALRDEEEALKEIEEAQHHPLVHFKVDGEPYETRERHLTPDQIIRQFAERDPATHYLKELSPGERSFKGEGGKEIKMVDGMAFVIMSTGSMTVSDGE